LSSFFPGHRALFRTLALEKEETFYTGKSSRPKPEKEGFHVQVYLVLAFLRALFDDPEVVRIAARIAAGMMQSRSPRSTAIQEAKNRFSKVVDRAFAQGVQIVTRHGKKIVVVMPFEEYERLTRQTGASLNSCWLHPCQD
jgi:prevent-host-death family protein